MEAPARSPRKRFGGDAEGCADASSENSSGIPQQMHAMQLKVAGHAHFRRSARHDR
jgi:hypothetical protein